MEIKAEPLKNKSKSWFWIIVGGILIISSLYLSLFEQTSRSPALEIFYIAAGVLIILEGLGRPIQSLWGNKFIQIDEKGLLIKLFLTRKGNWHKWDTLKQIDVWPGGFTLMVENQKKLKIDIKDFPPQNRHDLLKALIYHGKKNKIPYNLHGYLKNQD